MIRSRSFALMAAAAAVGISLCTVPAASAVTPDPVVPPPTEKIKINVATVLGSGCKAGTTAIAMSPDNEAMTITYSDYIAEIGPGIEKIKNRRNCQIAMKLQVPSGFSYGVVKADYRGLAKIAKGGKGIQQANYYFQGESANQTARSPFVGPYDNDYTITDETAIADVVWSPCGAERNFNANTSLRVEGDGKEYSMMTVDSTDVTVATKYHFAWKKCDK